MSSAQSIDRDFEDAPAPAAPEPLEPTLRSLFARFLPLAMTDLAMALADPLRTLALSRLPAPQLALAAVGVIKAVAIFLESPVIMILQASTALSKSQASYKALRNFAILLAAALTLVFITLNAEPVYSWLFLTVLGTGPEVAEVARIPFLLLVPWPAVIAWRRLFQGNLIHQHRERAIAWAGFGRLISVGGILALGVHYELSGALLASISLLGGVLFEAVAVSVAMRAQPTISPAQAVPSTSDETLPENLSEVGKFYAPLASTMMFVWGGRAILVGIIARAVDGPAALAAWTVAWGLIITASNATRMVQQVVISTGDTVRPAKLAQFVMGVGALFSLPLAFLAFTGLGDSVLAVLLAGQMKLQALVIPTMRLAIVFPFLLAAQNALQGFLIKGGRTGAINGAAMLGIATGLGVTACLVGFDAPGATAAAVGMVAGQALEVAILLVRFRGPRHRT